MKSRTIFLFFLGCCSILIASSLVDAILAGERIEYYITNDDTQVTFYGATWNSQLFTVGATGTNDFYYFSGINVKIYRTGLPRNCFYYIYNVVQSTNLPVGSAILSQSFNGDSLSTSAAWVEISYSGFNSICLNPSQKYALVIAAPSGSSGNSLSWRVDASSPTYTGGVRAYSINSGSTWTADSTMDFMFEIWGKEMIVEDDCPSTDLTVYNNTVNVTGGYESSYSSPSGWDVWLNFTGNTTPITTYENIVNASGTHEYILNSSGYHIFANYTGYSSELEVIENLADNVEGGYETAYSSSTGWTVWSNYTADCNPMEVSPLGSYNKWKLVSLPINETVAKEDVMFYNAVNNYTWAEAVDNEIILPFVYMWNVQFQYYDTTDYFYGYQGFWMYFYENYSLWIEECGIGEEYNTSVTVYNNTENVTGGYEYNYYQDAGFFIWLNYTAWDNSTELTVYDNTVNVTGDYETIYNWETGRYIWLNFTGNESSSSNTTLFISPSGSANNVMWLSVSIVGAMGVIVIGNKRKKKT